MKQIYGRRLRRYVDAAYENEEEHDDEESDQEVSDDEPTVQRLHY